jgi:hypothetical protein
MPASGKQQRFHHTSSHAISGSDGLPAASAPAPAAPGLPSTTTTGSTVDPATSSGRAYTAASNDQSARSGGGKRKALNNQKSAPAAKQRKAAGILGTALVRRILHLLVGATLIVEATQHYHCKRNICLATRFIRS